MSKLIKDPGEVILFQIKVDPFLESVYQTNSIAYHSTTC